MVFFLKHPNSSIMQWGLRTTALEENYKKLHFTREDPIYSKIAVKPRVRGYSPVNQILVNKFSKFTNGNPFYMELE